MYKSLFVPVSSHGKQEGALCFASALCDAFSARAESVYLSKTLALLDTKQKKAVGDTYRSKGYEASQLLTEQFYQEQFHASSQKVKTWFEKTKKGLGAPKGLVWRDASGLFGETAQQIADVTSFCDLTIASTDLSDSVYDDLVLGSLFLSGRPLALIKDYSAAKELEKAHIMVAWKHSPQTLRALWYALPLLKKAKAVTLVSVVEGDEDEQDYLDDAVSYLSDHGIKAQKIRIDNARYPVKALEDAYREKKADLLVMGAYSHSRLGELVFGGFTRSLLLEPKCNLFLVH
ncbi:MAG: universal stress protein [Rickettsiales bacterium]|jgi:nucleotide-binding universal stress UspA family protein|nr:universal stress protein [Rickettsiales bacterium]